jgi:hypothetical protein
MDAPRAMSCIDAPYRPSRDQGGRAIETRTCHKCGKSGHIATFCQSPPAYGTNKPPVVKENAAQTKASFQTDRVCYHCNQPGHFAAQCAKKRADLQTASNGKKMWCAHHKVESHNTVDCKARASHAPQASARAAQTAPSIDDETNTSQPSLAELQALWQDHHGSMIGYSAKVVPTAVSRLSSLHPMYVPRGQVAPLHSGLTLKTRRMKDSAALKRICR